MTKKTKICILWIIVINCTISMIYCIIRLFLVDRNLGMLSLITMIPYTIGVYFMLKANKS